MSPWIALLICATVVALVYVANRIGWVDLSNKNRSSGSGGGIAGIGDEVFHPTRFEAQIELDRQTILPAPAPVPGDGAGEKNVYNGRVEIDLRELEDTGPAGRHRA